MMCMSLCEILAQHLLPTADLPRVPGEACVRDAADEDYKVHGERHLHALQLWSQPARGVPPTQALQDRTRGGGQQQGGCENVY